MSIDDARLVVELAASLYSHTPADHEDRAAAAVEIAKQLITAAEAATGSTVSRPKRNFEPRSGDEGGFRPRPPRFEPRGDFGGDDEGGFRRPPSFSRFGDGGERPSRGGGFHSRPGEGEGQPSFRRPRKFEHDDQPPRTKKRF
ncbi:MAG: hypothetical protein FJX22_02995 [Alphaproteobacteria bacterium]|nr:hypothetical protein [Alphaproteobacteria bacterium]